MNIKNNKRKQASIQRIEQAFIELLKEKELNQIFVTDICKLANVNRTTFYANYLDIYDLAEKFGKKIIHNFYKAARGWVRQPFSSTLHVKPQPNRKILFL